MSIPTTLSFAIEDLVKLGLKNSENVHYQSSPEELVQDTIRLGDGELTDTGAIAIRTGFNSCLDPFIIIKSGQNDDLDLR